MARKVSDLLASHIFFIELYRKEMNYPYFFHKKWSFVWYFPH